jgi:LAS superfamily LD-carboxypeptidase LdcB
VSYFPQLTVTSVYRSRSEQLELYRNRRKNRYPVAPPGQSYHELGRAWDMTGPAHQLVHAGRVWQSWGGTWGGARDAIHFQA